MLGNVNIEVVQAWRAWYFSHVKNTKDRRQVDATLIVRGRTQDVQQKKERR